MDRLASITAYVRVIESGGLFGCESPPEPVPKAMVADQVRDRHAGIHRNNERDERAS